MYSDIDFYWLFSCKSFAGGVYVCPFILYNDECEHLGVPEEKCSVCKCDMHRKCYLRMWPKMDKGPRTIDCCTQHFPQEIMKDNSGPLGNMILKSALGIRSTEERDNANTTRLENLRKAVAFYSSYLGDLRDEGKDGKIKVSLLTSYMY